ESMRAKQDCKLIALSGMRIFSWKHLPCCASKRTVVTSTNANNVTTNVATKEHKRQVRGLIEGLESRVHVGPPIHAEELVSIRNFLHHSEFPPASDYYSRLTQIQERLEARSTDLRLPPTKRNYGGEAAGRWMQLQSAYDHIILSTCYEGEFNLKRGRIKISHRFNQEGRIDFVELKFLRSLHPFLNGAIRKLLTI